MQDLVSYDEKHNEANGEENRDGHNENLSWDCGTEGPTNDSAILDLREQQKRNFLATLFFSQGVPMLLGGDEMGRTQQGNNNAYCQDSELTWSHWSLDDRQRALLEFTRRLIHFRQAHPNLRRHKFFQGRPIRGSAVKDVAWIRADGGEMTDEEWSASWLRTLGVRLDGDVMAVVNEKGEHVHDDTVLILLNAHHEPVPFTLPAYVPGARWAVEFDTARPAVKRDEQVTAGGEPVTLEGRSLMLMRLVK